MTTPNPKLTDRRRDAFLITIGVVLSILGQALYDMMREIILGESLFLVVDAIASGVTVAIIAIVWKLASRY